MAERDPSSLITFGEYRDLERRLRDVEDLWDTFLHTPLWKRILFAIDGWPTDRLGPPRDRPWRRPLVVRGRTIWRGWTS
jgi:hypothetical protein